MLAPPPPSLSISRACLPILILYSQHCKNFRFCSAGCAQSIHAKTAKLPVPLLPPWWGRRQTPLPPHHHHLQPAHHINKHSDVTTVAQQKQHGNCKVWLVGLVGWPHGPAQYVPSTMMCHPIRAIITLCAIQPRAIHSVIQSVQSTRRHPIRAVHYAPYHTAQYLQYTAISTTANPRLVLAEVVRICIFENSSI